MDQQQRPSFGKWIFFGLAIFLFIQYGWPLITGKKDAPQVQPLVTNDAIPEGERADEEFCKIATPRQTLELGTHGASARSIMMVDPQYAQDVKKPDTRIDLVTTSREERMPLRDDLRDPDSDDESQLVASPSLDYKLTAQDGQSCTFVHTGKNATITKVVRAAKDRPFEYAIEVTIKNTSDAPKKIRYSIEQTAWRKQSETSSSFWDLGRKPEWMTEVSTHTTKKTIHEREGAFEPGDFGDEGFTKEKWLRAEGDGIWVAVNASYFASALVNTSASGPVPKAETLIEDGTFYGQHHDDPEYGHLYRARLVYPQQELEAGAETSYAVVAFNGPKERNVLPAIGGGTPDQYATADFIDLGMFGAIGKVLLKYVFFLHGIVGNWGWVIPLITLSLNILVFPLMIPNLRNSYKLRKIKPQLDEINEKYKDDMMQKSLATQELHRKHGIRLAVGCLPMLLQMPVWLSLYQGLATAVELYHVPFGPLIPDLSHADPYHVIPIVLGISSFFQQKLIPAQGMDPAQQKMMLYMMPAVLMIMMFFLPAGLGVYMLTNTWLRIGQQFATERVMQARLAGEKNAAAAGEIKVRDLSKDDDEGPASAPALGKGKVRARG